VCALSHVYRESQQELQTRWLCCIGTAALTAIM
jgi:hypothetical protein